MVGSPNTQVIEQNSRKIVQLVRTKTNTLIRNERNKYKNNNNWKSIDKIGILPGFNCLKPETNSIRYKNKSDGRCWIWLSWAYLFGKNWPYLSNGFGQTFFSSISLLAALFFSAVSVLLVWARDTGNVAILSPLSTSTVEIFESGPPIALNYFSLSFSFAQTAVF